jgi:hypothetical protein
MNSLSRLVSLPHRSSSRFNESKEYKCSEECIDMVSLDETIRPRIGKAGIILKQFVIMTEANTTTTLLLLKFIWPLFISPADLNPD